MKKSFFAKSVVITAGVFFAVVSPISAQTLFSDDFNTVGSAANYTAATFGVTAVTYAFDYSALGIPSAPNTIGGSTLGVKFEANMTAPGAAAAVTLHSIQQFTASYIVRFDAWINANGPFPGGGSGSTEFLTAGVGGNGTAVNRTGATGSGAWVGVDGEGGSGIDYRLFRNAGVLEGVASGSYEAGTQSTARAATDPYYASFGAISVGDLAVQGANNGGPAQQTGTTIAGSFGFEWHEVELRVDANGGTGGATLMAWYIDGLLIGSLDAGAGTSFPTDGGVTIGYMDPFSSVSDNATLSFGLIDNLTVAVPEPSTIVLGLMGGLSLLFLARRRK